MLLGHWYLVQPGLARDPIRELVRWSAWIWPLEVALLLVPTGMVSVLNGSIDDGYGGLLGVMWIVCALDDARPARRDAGWPCASATTRR